jgi:hypothetical protein
MNIDRRVWEVVGVLMVVLGGFQTCMWHLGTALLYMLAALLCLFLASRTKSF